MKAQIRAPEKIQLSKKEIANLSVSQFKTLVIKTLTELVEFVRKLDEKMKPMPRETKENVQGTNSDAKKTGTQITVVNQKEDRNIQPEKKEETRIQKNEERLRNLQDISKRSNIWIIGVPEGEEEEQKTWKLIWTNNEVELPQSGKGNRLPGSPGSSESPKEAGPKKEHTKAHYHYITQD